LLHHNQYKSGSSQLKRLAKTTEFKGKRFSLEILDNSNTGKYRQLDALDLEFKIPLTHLFRKGLENNLARFAIGTLFSLTLFRFLLLPQSPTLRNLLSLRLCSILSDFSPELKSQSLLQLVFVKFAKGVWASSMPGAVDVHPLIWTLLFNLDTGV